MQEKIFVYGFGIMGSAIAQVFAQSGFEVVAMDVDEGQLKKGMKQINGSIRKLLEKGLVKGSAGEIIERISKTQEIEDAAKSVLVIEAVYEDIELKKQVFGKLDSVCPPKTILASNTSSFLITEIASSTKNPERVIGTHFFNPVPMMKLVEIIRGLVTSSDTVERTKELLLSIGKDPIIVEKEIPGFIVNRINGMVYLEALRLLELGIATVADIDKGLKLGTGYAMGPFEAMDIIGLDTVLKSRMGIYEQTKDTRFFPPDILRKMVAAGLHGRKTNKGFYEYTPEGKKIV